jgi:hypothetical protein
MIERGVHVSCGLGRLRLPVTDIVGVNSVPGMNRLDAGAGARISSFSFYLRGLVGSIMVPMRGLASLSCFARVRE